MIAAAFSRFDAERAKRRTTRQVELRQRLADAVESMIAVLDALDGDSDAEDDGTAEPSLGWTRTMAWGSTDDREEGAATVDTLQTVPR